MTPGKLEAYNAIANKVRETMKKAAGIWPRIGMRCMPHIRLDLNSAHTYGEAWLHKWMIRFNIRAYRPNPAKYLNQTVVHECAHLIAYALNPRNTGHGKGWQEVMKRLGAEPKRCSAYRLELKPHEFRYVCKCNFEHVVSRRTHKKIQAGDKYVCSNCKAFLVYADSGNEAGYSDRAVASDRSKC